MCTKKKLDNLLMPHTRINSKFIGVWIKDLNVILETIKVSRKHMQ